MLFSDEGRLTRREWRRFLALMVVDTGVVLGGIWLWFALIRWVS